jgi:hypothetical protein
MKPAEFYKAALAELLAELYKMRAIAGVLSSEAYNSMPMDRRLDPDDINNIQGLAATLRDETRRAVDFLEKIEA